MILYSGAEGTVIEEPGNAAGVIWGLDPKTKPYKSTNLPIGSDTRSRPSYAVKIQAPPPKVVQVPMTEAMQAQPSFMYQAQAPPMMRNMAPRFHHPQTMQSSRQTYHPIHAHMPMPSAPRYHPTATRPVAPPVTLSPFMTHPAMYTSPMPTAMPSPVTSSASMPFLPAQSAAPVYNMPPPNSARAKVRAFDHGPLDLEEIRREVMMENLRATGTPFAPSGSHHTMASPPPHSQAPAHFNVEPWAPSVQQVEQRLPVQHPVIGQRLESVIYDTSPPTPHHHFNHQPTSSLDTSPAFSTPSFDSQDALLVTPPTTSAPVFSVPIMHSPDFSFPRDPAIAKMGLPMNVKPDIEYAQSLLAPIRDLRQLRVVSDPCVHASLHSSARASSTTSMFVSESTVRPRLPSNNDVISLVDLRTTFAVDPSPPSAIPTAQPIDYYRQRSFSSLHAPDLGSVVPQESLPPTSPVQPPTLPLAPCQKAGLGPYRAPRSVPLAKLVQRRMPSLPALLEEPTPPATPTTPSGIGLGFHNDLTSPTPQRRSASHADVARVPAYTGTMPAMRTTSAHGTTQPTSSSASTSTSAAKPIHVRGPSADGAKGFGLRRTVRAPSMSPPSVLPPSPLRQVVAGEDLDVEAAAAVAPCGTSPHDLPLLPLVVSMAATSVVEDDDPTSAFAACIPVPVKEANIVKHVKHVSLAEVTTTPQRRAPHTAKKISQRKATPGAIRVRRNSPTTGSHSVTPAAKVVVSGKHRRENKTEIGATRTVRTSGRAGTDRVGNSAGRAVTQTA
jgi:hypothetical protein